MTSVISCAETGSTSAPFFGYSFSSPSVSSRSSASRTGVRDTPTASASSPSVRRVPPS